MRVASWGLLSAMVLFVGAWSVLLMRMWILRKHFDIAARSPFMVCMAQLTCAVSMVMVTLNWLLLLEDRNLPCYAIIWVQYFLFAFGTTPYFIRVVRLVVAYHTEYRVKYGRFVKLGPMMRLWAITAVGLMGRCLIFYLSRFKDSYAGRGARECFFFDDILLFFLAGVFGAVPAILLAGKLRNVDDAFGLRHEMECAIGLCIVFGTVPIVGLQALVMFGLLRDSRNVHIVVEASTFFFAVNVGFWGLATPMASHLRWRVAQPSKRKVHPTRERTDTNHDMLTGVTGVLDFAGTGGMAEVRFGQFCLEHLCMESWDFIVEVALYEAATPDPDKQFENFRGILEGYLLPTSPNEVNISSSMSKRMVAFKTRAAFDSLNEEERRCVFKEPLNEIVRMLEQNLLTKFREETQHQQRISLARAMSGDKEMMMLMSCAPEATPEAGSGR